MPVGTAGSRTGVNLSMGATSQVERVSRCPAYLRCSRLPHRAHPVPARRHACRDIVTGAIPLIDPAQWRSLGRSDRAELAIAVVTAVAVINLGVLVALVVAVVLSLLDVVRRIARPHDAVLGWSPADLRFADVNSGPDVAVTPSVVVYRFSDRLFFANVHFFKRRVWAAVDAAPKPYPAPRARHGGSARHGRQRRRRTAGAPRRSAGAQRQSADRPGHRPVGSVDGRLGMVELIGTDNFYATVTAAVDHGDHDPEE